MSDYVKSVAEIYGLKESVVKEILNTGISSTCSIVRKGGDLRVKSIFKFYTDKKEFINRKKKQNGTT